ncbi:hypothetical protein LZ30DRAFT_162448 [Colletotrichum cereale]|nr:hypothetical protein LZ30DRAFT_162448 [Colletotrichum cereale]
MLFTKQRACKTSKRLDGGCPARSFPEQGQWSGMIGTTERVPLQDLASMQQDLAYGWGGRIERCHAEHRWRVASSPVSVKGKGVEGERPRGGRGLERPQGHIVRLGLQVPFPSLANHDVVSICSKMETPRLEAELSTTARFRGSQRPEVRSWCKSNQTTPPSPGFLYSFSARGRLDYWMRTAGILFSTGEAADGRRLAAGSV